MQLLFVSMVQRDDSCAETLLTLKNRTNTKEKTLTGI